MISMFMQTTLVMLIRLHKAVVNCDLIALDQASHELKSCSANIGAYSLAARCAGLELIARDGHLPNPDFWIEAIGIEYRRAEAALIARLAGLELVAADRSAETPAPILYPVKTQ